MGFFKRKEAQPGLISTPGKPTFLNPEMEPPLGRPWSVALSAIEWTVVEHIQPVVSEHQDNFDSLQLLEPTLAASRNGLGFAGALLTNTGNYVSPPWINVRCGQLRSNDVVLAGFPTHRIFDNPGTLDLGVRDGRNLFQWGSGAPKGLTSTHSSLYFGNCSDEIGYLELGPVAGDVIDTDTTKGSPYAFALEYTDNHSVVLCSIDRQTHERTYSLELGGAFGNETVQISQDSDWVLVQFSNKLIIGNPSTGQFIDIEVPSLDAACWWPRRSVSSIAITQWQPDSVVLSCFDLATNKTEIIGTVSDGQPGRPHVNRLRMHPTLNCALAGSRHGTNEEHRYKHGTKVRVGLLNLDTLRIDALTDAFMDSTNSFERDHSKWDWTTDPAPSQMIVAPELLASTFHVQPRPGVIPSQRAASASRDAIIMAGQAFVDHLDNPHLLRTEVLRFVEAGMTHGFDTEVREWLEILVNGNHRTVGDSSRLFGDDRQHWPAPARALAAFSSSLDLVLAGRADEIHWGAERTR
jgi:hypothetical protein